MMISLKRAVAGVIDRLALKKTQAGARSVSATTLNYASVNVVNPSVLARAFAAADQGEITDQATLFELVEEQDAHIFGELAKRRRAVTGLGWQLEPMADATQSEIDRATELADMIRRIPRIEDAQYDMTDAIGKGFVALELNWTPGDVWLPRPSETMAAIQWVPQRMFQVNNFGDRIGELQYLKDGVPESLIPGRWLVHEHRAKSGYIEAAALFRVLAWTYAYKSYDVRDMQKFLELYGLPLRLGKYPSGIGDKARDQLLRAVRGIGHDGAGVVPSEMVIEFIQASKAGTVDDFLSAISYWEKKQSIAILGGTLTSQADGKTSTNALGEIHNQVRREIMLHDVRQIEPTLTEQLVRPIALLNGIFPPDRVPTWAYQTEETPDQAKMVRVLREAVNIGLEIDLDWAHKAMQIPRAEAGAEMLKPAAVPAPETDPDANPGDGKGGKGGKDDNGDDEDDDKDIAPARRAALTRDGADDASALTSAYAAQMAALCAPFEQKIIDQIATIVAEADDFDTALEGIAALKRDKANYDAWAKTIAQGLTVAHLAGIDAVRKR